MITLPFPPRRARLLSFWLVMSLAAGLFTAVLFVVLLSEYWLVLAGTMALILTVPVLLQPQMASIPYRAWNKLARLFGQGARFYLMGIWFYMFFFLVGRAGSSLRLARHTADSSLWVPWQTRIGPGLGEEPHGVIVEESLDRNWISAFLAWAKESNNRWAYCLLPLFILISFLDIEEEEDDSSPSGIYTLY